MSAAAPNTNAKEDKKSGDPTMPIGLKVKGQDGKELFFRIKRKTQLRKLMNAYSARQNEDMNSFAFLFEGRLIRAEQTPEELEMEDGDVIDANVIDAVLHQESGEESC